MVKAIPVEAFTMTHEQAFQIASMKTYIKQISREDLEMMLIDSMSQNMFMKNIVKSIAKGEY
jgi:hypothetical protein